MKISAGARSRMAGLIESSTGTGLKFGIPVMALSAAYLLYIVFGPKLNVLAAMSAADRAYLHASVTTAITVFRLASLVVSLSLALRFYYDALAGQVMSIAGGVLYFLSPTVFSIFTGDRLSKIQTYQEIVAEFVRLGFVALMPGGILVARDISARIVTRVRIGWDAKIKSDRAKGLRHRKLLENCWDMPLCPDYVRKYCPAWDRRKPCWRIKSGCLCEGEGATRAMVADSTDDRFAKRLIQGISEEKQRASELPASRKRARCRRCMIYAEHQRQKYRILSALVFPAVALIFWLCYNQLTAMAWSLLEKTDRFMSFLAYSPGHAASFASQGHILTTLALVWLGIVVLSYALRAVEYLIFDLQV